MTFAMNLLEPHEKGSPEVIEVPGAKEALLSLSPRDTVPVLANGLIVVYDEAVGEADKKKVRTKAGARVNSVYTGHPIEHLAFSRAKEPGALQKIKATLEADNRVVSVDYDRVIDMILPNLRQQRERERQQRERERVQREADARRRPPPKPPHKPQGTPPRKPPKQPKPPGKPDPQAQPAEVAGMRNFPTLNVPAAWDLSTGSGVKVAVMDTGYDHAHLEVAPQVVGEYDFLRNDAIANDEEGHGTGMGSIVAAPLNGHGMAGVAPNAKLLMAKIWTPGAGISSSQVLSAWNWAVTNGARVFTESIVWTGFDSSLQAWSNAHYQNISLFVCMGNDGVRRTDLYPPNYIGWQGVAGSKIDGSGWWPSSTWGPASDISAPGEFVLCAKYDKPDHYFVGDTFGTSVSAPQVAGIAALIYSRHPTFNADKVWDSIRTTAHNPQTPGGYDEKMGWGVPNAYAAVAKP
jgi:subtilisin family serine protease